MIQNGHGDIELRREKLKHNAHAQLSLQTNKFVCGYIRTYIRSYVHTYVRDT